MKKYISVFLVAVFLGAFACAAAAAEPLKLIAKYKMPPSVTGRFDHLGVDLGTHRLLATAESAHEVVVFNLQNGDFIRAISGIGIPHAIFCREDLNRIYITDGGAGEVRIYSGKNYRQIGTVKLKVDSDSVGYDPSTHDLYIDNGGGDAHESYSMLSVVNTTTGKKVADIKIDGDTLEAMALAHSSPRLYVNNPAKNQVDVLDRNTRKVVATWTVTMGRRNVAMALDESAHRLFVACRSGSIVVFDTQTGKELKSLPIARGVDDLIFNPATKRLYAACGADGGSIAVYHVDSPDQFSSLGRVPTAPRSKNIVLVPSLGRIYTTVPPENGAPGEIYVYQID